MLDIKFIRENKDLVQEGAKKKRVDFNVEDLIAVDDNRLELLADVENMRTEQNKKSNEIKETVDEDARSQMISSSRELKEKLQKKEEELKDIVTKWKELMIRVPNIPDVSVPDGKDENDNKELKVAGEKPDFLFRPKDHIELMTKLDMASFERGSKVHGFRGYFLKNDGALLSWAIWNYAQEFFLKKGFTPFIAPSIVKKEYFYGTGHLPNDAEDLYKTQDDDYLSGTAEVPMMAYHSGEVIPKESLPIRYLAFSPCYRREAGSYGKDTKGLMRVHEFFKFEQLIICEASHEESVKLHEEINANMEEFVESLGLPYRRLAISTGDLKGSHVKSYDTELWIPSQGAYREIGSASYYHDFQTRRFNIKYNNGGEKKYAHSLNGTAIPTPRVLISLVENYQQEDGSIKIPKVLQKYMGNKDIIKKQ